FAPNPAALVTAVSTSRRLCTRSPGRGASCKKATRNEGVGIISNDTVAGNTIAATLDRLAVRNCRRVSFILFLLPWQLSRVKVESKNPSGWRPDQPTTIQLLPFGL